MIHSSALYMLANIDERIKDKILTCVIYDFKKAEYRYVLSFILNYCIMYLWVATMLAAACSLNRSLLVTQLISTVDVFVLHLYWQNK